jgi:hypothetical protein
MVKERMQGKVRKQRKEAIEGYFKKRGAHFDAGRVGIMVDSVLGRRLGLGVIGQVLQPDGKEAVGSEEVTRTLHDHLLAHWHENTEVDCSRTHMPVPKVRQEILVPGRGLVTKPRFYAVPGGEERAGTPDGHVSAQGWRRAHRP